MNQTNTQIPELMREVIQAFTKRHDALKFTNETLGRVQVINLECDMEDYGKLIGHQGVMLDALKYLASLFGRKCNQHVEFMVLRSSHGDTSGKLPPFRSANHWDSTRVAVLANKIMEKIFTLPYSLDVGDGKAVTVLTVKLHPGEPMKAEVPAIQTALKLIFKAVGKSHGRDEIITDIFTEATAKAA